MGREVIGDVRGLWDEFSLVGQKEEIFALSLSLASHLSGGSMGTTLVSLLV